MELVERVESGNPVESPLVSVCIANYNGSGVVEQCINSVLNQDFDDAFEIIVHDDASQDESVTLIQEQFSDIEFLISHENVGYCESNNRMVNIARGEYILLLNNDAELYPDALRSLLSHAQQQKIPGILTLPQFEYESNLLVDRGMLLDPFLNPIPNYSNELDELGMCMGACLWIRRSLWLDLEGFPTWFDSLAEDMYLCCCARLWGITIETVQQSGYKHRIGYSFGGGKVSNAKINTSMRRRQLSERNKSYVMAVCYPLPAFIIIFPLHLLLLLTEGIILATIKRKFLLFSEVYLGCMLELWKNKKLLKEQRKIIQQKKVVSTARFFKPVKWQFRKLTMLLEFGVPTIHSR